MKRKNLLKLIALAIILPGFLLTSCSKKLSTAENTGTFLKYAFEGDTEYKYSSTSIIDQSIFYGGQEISALIESNLSFGVASAGLNGDLLELKVSVDSITSNAKSMQGDLSSDSKEVRGKEFTMNLSTSGKESGLDEAEKIKYTAVGDQETNLKASFSLLFSDLPAEAVKIGYTWTQSDTIDLSVGEQNVLMIINSNNLIESKETINGFDCYKISSTNTGERNASGNTPQGFMTSTGTMTGSGYFYFAPKEGVVVQERQKQVFDGEITIPTGDSLPMMMDIKINTDLIK